MSLLCPTCAALGHRSGWCLAIGSSGLDTQMTATTLRQWTKTRPSRPDVRAWGRDIWPWAELGARRPGRSIGSGTRGSALGCSPCRMNREGYARAPKVERNSASARFGTLANLDPFQKWRTSLAKATKISLITQCRLPEMLHVKREQLLQQRMWW